MNDRGLGTIAEWGAALRAARVRRRRLLRRGLLVGGLVAALGVTVLAPPRPLLVWNVSASAPVGLYAVGDARSLAAGDMVVARMPERWRLFAARRHYIPANVPLVKRVAAMPGERVCALGPWLWVEDHQVAVRRAFDARRRVMPHWSGCLTLSADHLLLLMDDPGSFDGRYFGVSDRSDLVGRAMPLWTR